MESLVSDVSLDQDDLEMLRHDTDAVPSSDLECFLSNKQFESKPCT